MKRGVLIVPAVLLAALGAGDSSAAVRVAIDLTHQRMRVQSATGSYDWPISSARSGFSTPRGSYAPTRLEPMHYSRKYHMSPMPHAIFFRGGYAIHGTYSVGALGRPASHGCVRLSPGHAATLYQMVQGEGARISISGSPPGGTRLAQRSRRVVVAAVARVTAPRPRVAAMMPRRSIEAPRRLASPATRVVRFARRPSRGFAGPRLYGYQPMPYGTGPVYVHGPIVYSQLPAYPHAPVDSYAPVYAPVYAPAPQIIYGAPVDPAPY